MPDTRLVGFIGLGLMGKPMAKNLLKAGHRLIVHSRSPGPVNELAALGAAAAGSPGDVARQASRIFLMLPDAPDVADVIEGVDGLLDRLQPGTIVIDNSTISPVAARRLAERVAERGGTMIDAPVSGGEIGAIEGTLSIMAGGDAAAFAAVRPLL
jgi:2-hydroxy-3-oxopropionate reductase